MTLYWIIDSKEKLTTAVATGALTSTDLLDYVRAITGAKAVDYRQLLDFSDATTMPSLREAIEIGVHLRLSLGPAVAGPIAVVRFARPSEAFARLLGIMATSRKPVRLFDDAAAARAWLDGRTGS